MMFWSRTIRAAMIAAALFGCTASASAKDPSPAAITLAEQLIKVKGASNMYGPVLVGIIEKAKYTFMQTNPALSNDLNAVAVQLRKEFQPRLDQLMHEVAKLYASHFTEKELTDALAFYRSPLGAKLVKAEPQIVNESMAVANDWASKLADDVMAKMREEMQKKGHQL